MARRTVMYSSKGKKLYAVRDKGGKFKDIQQYSRAHAQDIKRGSSAETKAAAKKAAKPAKKKAVKKAAVGPRPPAPAVEARDVAVDAPLAVLLRVVGSDGLDRVFPTEADKIPGHQSDKPLRRVHIVLKDDEAIRAKVEQVHDASGEVPGASEPV